jgi:hypothetical protein
LIENLLGVSLPVFAGVTLVLMGAAAFLTGQAVGATWRPRWQVVLYCVLLALSGRFLSLSLFYGDPFFQPLNWLYGTIVDSLALVPIGLFAHAVTRAAWMTRQYPWLYERAGLFSYREKG